MISKEYLSKFDNVCGVYIFRDTVGLPTYIGKSIRIRDRLLSHFRDAQTVEKEQSIMSTSSVIDIIPTAGELGALIRESFLVKQLLPLYNRQLRRKSFVTAATYAISEEGYFTVDTTLVQESEIKPTGSFLGTYTSKKSVINHLRMKAEKYNLCSKLLGLEKTKAACFRYHLEKCHGACIGKEAPEEYNKRFLKAFSRDKYIEWPFEGPIAFEEKSNTMSEEFVIQNWLITESSRDLGLDGFPAWISQLGFEKDRYMILKKHLLSFDHIDEIEIMV